MFDSPFHFSLFLHSVLLSKILLVRTRTKLVCWIRYKSVSEYFIKVVWLQSSMLPSFVLHILDQFYPREYRKWQITVKILNINYCLLILRFENYEFTRNKILWIYCTTLIYFDNYNISNKNIPKLISSSLLQHSTNYCQSQPTTATLRGLLQIAVMLLALRCLFNSLESKLSNDNCIWVLNAYEVQQIKPHKFNHTLQLIHQTTHTHGNWLVLLQNSDEWRADGPNIFSLSPTHSLHGYHIPYLVNILLICLL